MEMLIELDIFIKVFFEGVTCAASSILVLGLMALIHNMCKFHLSTTEILSALFDDQFQFVCPMQTILEKYSIQYLCV